jgi:hypothetical protein
MDVVRWAKNFPPGSKVVYAHRSYYQEPNKGALASAYSAHSQGLVFLAQRRGKNGIWHFEATRVSIKVAKQLGIWPEQKRLV